MGNDRREFIKQTGLAGLALSGAGMAGAGQARSQDPPWQKHHHQKFNMHGYAAPPLETVRMGLIGIGSRGSGTVRRMATIEGVEIKALCDLYSDRVKAGIESIKGFPQHDPDAYSGSEDEWRKVCEREDINFIYTATPWRLHPVIAKYAMEQGKHVYTELPVGNTIEEIWDVVETSERTRRHCFMGCGSCHSSMEAAVLNMVREGFFGELVHGEGTYIHDRVSDPDRWDRQEDNHGWFGFRPWRLKENIDRNGNLYPAHGLGPLAQMMNLNYGDQMKYMVSISTDDFTLGDKMEELAPKDQYFEPYTGLDFRGNMNTSIIRTHRGRTIMLQHDISTPRPGVRFQLISGTQGIYHAEPPRPRIATGEEWMPEEEFASLIEKYTPKLTKRFNQKVSKAEKISTERSYEEVTAKDWRLIDCLRNGLPLEMDVYDAALWSAVTPLSEWSAAHEGATVEVPDFTCGSWKTNKPGMNVSFEKGGTTNLI